MFKDKKQKGIFSIFFLIATTGIASFLAISSSTSFKDKVLGLLYPKTVYAATSGDNPYQDYIEGLCDKNSDNFDACLDFIDLVANDPDKNHTQNRCYDKKTENEVRQCLVNIKQSFARSYEPVLNSFCGDNNGVATNTQDECKISAWEEGGLDKKGCRLQIGSIEAFTNCVKAYAKDNYRGTTDYTQGIDYLVNNGLSQQKIDTIRNAWCGQAGKLAFELGIPGDPKTAGAYSSDICFISKGTSCAEAVNKQKTDGKLKTEELESAFTACVKEDFDLFTLVKIKCNAKNKKLSTCYEQIKKGCFDLNKYDAACIEAEVDKTATTPGSSAGAAPVGAVLPPVGAIIPEEDSPASGASGTSSASGGSTSTADSTASTQLSDEFTSIRDAWCGSGNGIVADSKNKGCKDSVTSDCADKKDKAEFTKCAQSIAFKAEHGGIFNPNAVTAVPTEAQIYTCEVKDVEAQKEGSDQAKATAALTSGSTTFFNRANWFLGQTDQFEDTGSQKGLPKNRLFLGANKTLGNSGFAAGLKDLKDNTVYSVTAQFWSTIITDDDITSGRATSIEKAGSSDLKAAITCKGKTFTYKKTIAMSGANRLSNAGFSTDSRVLGVEINNPGYPVNGLLNFTPLVTPQVNPGNISQIISLSVLARTFDQQGQLLDEVFNASSENGRQISLNINNPKAAFVRIIASYFDPSNIYQPAIITKDIPLTEGLGALATTTDNSYHLSLSGSKNHFRSGEPIVVKAILPKSIESPKFQIKDPEGTTNVQPTSFSCDTSQAVCVYYYYFAPKATGSYTVALITNGQTIKQAGNLSFEVSLEGTTSDSRGLQINYFMPDVKGITVDTFNPIPTPLELALNGQVSQIECKKSEDIFKPVGLEEISAVIYTDPNDISQLAEVLDEPKIIVFLPKSADGVIYAFNDWSIINQSWFWGWGKFDKDADIPELTEAFDRAREVRDSINSTITPDNTYLNGKVVSPSVAATSMIIKCDDGDFMSLAMWSPLIYLYNTKTEPVSVKVKPPIVSTEVELNSNGFWNVITSPDGLLTSQDGKKHRFLPYEFLRSDFKRPIKGSVIDGSGLERYLKEDLWPRLELTESEIKDYWQDTKPRVKPSPYYFVSLIDKSEIDRVLPMEVNPKPDTLIRNMTYILPLSKAFTPKPLDEEKLNTPKREGFTVLENGVFVDGF